MIVVTEAEAVLAARCMKLRQPAAEFDPVRVRGTGRFPEILEDESVDLRAFQNDTLLWETRLPDALQWTSVITVTEDHLVGTATRFTPSETAIFTVELPSTAQSELVLIDRHTGAVAFRAPITDDSSSTVTVGPDGSLYVTLLSLLHTMSIDTDPVAGVMRFLPVASD